MSKVLKTTLISLFCISVFSLIAFVVEQRAAVRYNKDFPERYISETYPGSEVIDLDKSRSLWKSSGYRSSICYDSTEDLYFTQLYDTARSGKMIPNDEPDPHNHERSLAYRKAVLRCMDKASMLSGEYKAYLDPHSNRSFFIIMKYDGSWEIYDLMKTLNDVVCEERQKDPDIYICYRIILCGENTYDRINSCGFFGKMDTVSAQSINCCDLGSFWNGIKVFSVRLEMNEGGGNEDLYRILRETNLQYHDDILLWISGEPNAVNQQKYAFYGVQYNDTDSITKGE